MFEASRHHLSNQDLNFESRTFMNLARNMSSYLGVPFESFSYNFDDSNIDELIRRSRRNETTFPLSSNHSERDKKFREETLSDSRFRDNSGIGSEDDDDREVSSSRGMSPRLEEVVCIRNLLGKCIAYL